MSSSPSLSDHSLPVSPEPEAGRDPVDPVQPLEGIQDLPAVSVGSSRAAMDDISDNESILSEVDEAQFEDFDPNQIAIEERPAIAVDEDNVKLLGRHKRKRDGEVDGEGGKRKKREGKREKPKKIRRKQDSDDDFSGGQEMEGKRIRKKKAFTEGGEKVRREKPKARKATPENEEAMDPEERKSRVLQSTYVSTGSQQINVRRTSTCARQSYGRCPKEPNQATPQGRRHCTSDPSSIPLLTYTDGQSRI